MNDFSVFRDLLALGGIVLFILGIGVLIGLAVMILYLNTLYTTLKEVSPQNRKMDPGLVWLLIIPYFSTIFFYFVMKAISDSLETEFRMRGVPSESKPTYNIGISYFIIAIAGLAISIGSWFSLLPKLVMLSGLLSLTGVIIWIIYWVQVAQQRTKLRSTMGMNTESSIF